MQNSPQRKASDWFRRVQEKASCNWDQIERERNKEIEDRGLKDGRH